MNYFKNAKFFRRMALALLVLPCFVGGGIFGKCGRWLCVKARNALGLDCYRFQH